MHLLIIISNHLSHSLKLLLGVWHLRLLTLYAFLLYRGVAMMVAVVVTIERNILFIILNVVDISFSLDVPNHILRDKV